MTKIDMHTGICLSIRPFVRLSMSLSIYLSIYLSISISLSLSISISLNLSNSMSRDVFICVFICLHGVLHVFVHLSPRPGPVVCLLGHRGEIPIKALNIFEPMDRGYLIPHFQFVSDFSNFVGFETILVAQKAV